MMVTEEIVREKLKEVYDPEIGINIVDLGLVYDIQVSEQNDVQVVMTLTTPGCPLHGSITAGARSAVELIEGVRSANVDLVWDPIWNPEMMSDAAKKQLGRA